ncbi:hypothetical protein L596_018379 [Steinernema carpocapsae]|uniref:Uncharacterized protein n=1 Tax=Steinernema carpocapsae TaxID=34508 RepID=A0A4U5N4G2_STECR|nr:hypothetical protein L596_018379 [Steinernema carpocapsae]
MDTSTLDTTPLSRKRRSDVSDPSEEPPKKVKSLSVLNPNSSAARREKPTPTSSRFYERFEESDWRDVATKKGEQSTKQLLCAVASTKTSNDFLQGCGALAFGRAFGYVLLYGSTFCYMESEFTGLIAPKLHRFTTSSLSEMLEQSGSHRIPCLFTSNVDSAPLRHDRQRLEKQRNE